MCGENEPECWMMRIEKLRWKQAAADGACPQKDGQVILRAVRILSRGRGDGPNWVTVSPVFPAPRRSSRRPPIRPPVPLASPPPI